MPPNERLLSSNSGTDTGVDLVPIVADDNDDLPIWARGLQCRSDGTAGTVRMVTFSGNLRDTYISPGQYIPCAVIRVHSTGTSAVGLEALI